MQRRGMRGDGVSGTKLPLLFLEIEGFGKIQCEEIENVVRDI